MKIAHFEQILAARTNKGETIEGFEGKIFDPSTDPNKFAGRKLITGSEKSKVHCSKSLFRRLRVAVTLLLLGFALNKGALASVTASIEGTVRDTSGAVIPGAQVTATNTDTLVSQVVSTNSQGSYTFPALQPGKYEVTIDAPNFSTFKQTGIVLNVNDVLTLDAALQVGRADQVITVSGEALHAETASTQMGEVIEGQTITSVPLNGRSYTDLLALQPGVANQGSGVGGGSSSSANFESAGIHIPLVSGGESAGNQSVNGMREAANGFLLDGISVQEFEFSGAAAVPDLDSISEFRILTNNFDAEYGSFAGGQINVVTKSGANGLHGNLFEFLRNTDLDAANYFDQGKRGPFQQNQFGGTVGGPIRKDKVFFFADYQRNLNVEGIATGSVSVPTAAERSGDFSAPALESAMSASSVQGTYWANTLSNELGYSVTVGEPYYSTGCASNSSCVFPNAHIPTGAISPVAKNILALGAIPLGDGQGLFSTSAYKQRLTDDKTSGRIDSNTRIGSIFGYYFFDQFSLLNPYPVATVPGFAASTTGRTQVIDIGDTKTIGSTKVNEARIGYLRLNEAIGTPSPSITASFNGLGFVTGSAPGAINPLDPATEGVPTMEFEDFNIGGPSIFPRLIENTYQASDNFSQLIRTHSLKFGVAFRYTQLAYAVENAENGRFLFNQTLETGVDFADFLIGAVSAFSQGQTPASNTRDYYLGAFAQDSWRARSNLTLNYGVRWDVIPPWWEKHNHMETLVPGEQSVEFPNSPAGWVFPGDPGIPRTVAPIQYHNFTPRIGLAYSPSSSSEAFHKLFGSQGQTSIRLGYGMFFTAFEGGYDLSVNGDAPYGFWYATNGVVLATPYQDRATGAFSPNPFPYAFPPDNVSASNPDSSFPASAFGVISSSPGFNRNNLVPYAEQYELSIQRQLAASNLLTVSYVGTQGHRLLVSQEVNPVNQAACLAIYEQDPSSSACGPNTEPNNLRAPFGANFASDADFSTIGTSAYNSLQVSLQHSGGPSQFLLSYTYSKSLDDSSSFAEQVNPYVPSLTRGLSAFNIPQNFVADYSYTLPTGKLRGPRQLVDGWQLSGITSFSNGIPVYIYENDDNSLLGTDNSGPLPLGIDTPNYSGGSVKKLNPRNSGNPYFDTSKFSAEPIGQLGTARRRFFSGPGFNNFDMALSKETKLSERVALQFRAEFFNLFNHTQFQSIPQSNGNFNSSEFGAASSAADPRIGQLALKLRF